MVLVRSFIIRVVKGRDSGHENCLVNISWPAYHVIINDNHILKDTYNHIAKDKDGTSRKINQETNTCLFRQQQNPENDLGLKF